MWVYFSFVSHVHINFGSLFLAPVPFWSIAKDRAEEKEIVGLHDGFENFCSEGDIFYFHWQFIG